jgi:hypothetical protein
MSSCSVPGGYSRRRPEKTQLYQAVAQNLELFYEHYDARFIEHYGPLSARSILTLERFVGCGLLSEGFGRARCDDCSREIAVAFSCQLRGVCPSCQQKRAELLCRFVQEEVIEPVDHRQLVFVLPKKFRRNFMGERHMLRGLNRAAAKATQAFYRAGLGRDDVKVGMVSHLQLFGDAVNPHPHLHSLSTDGAFDADGNFYQLSFDAHDDIQTLRRLFEGEVLDFLVQQGRLSERHRDDMLSWEHTGFSVDGSVRVHKGDYAALRRLMRYMARPPVSFERVSYDEGSGKVVVRSCKKQRRERRVTGTYDVLQFLALLTQQVPPKGTHMVRYSGWYSSRSRAKRRRLAEGGRPRVQVKEVASPKAKERRRRWAELIRQVFEVDPLRCRCGGTMRLVSFVSKSQPEVLEKILQAWGESTEPASRGPPKWYEMQRALQHTQQNAHVYAGFDDTQAEYDPDAAWSSGEWQDA